MIDRKRTACFTGHRRIPENDKAKLRIQLDRIIEALYNKGVVFFGCGGAYGFDTEAEYAVLRAKERRKEIKLILVLSYMNDQILGKGNSIAAIDEAYLFLYNRTAIEYIRNGMKRCRKKESAFILASQNLEDFLQPEIRELTKPLFSIPTHHFLFNPGNIKAEEFIDTLQLEPAEYELIRFPERGTCLYRCGNERYLLMVKAPKYKAVLFGAAGGR